MCLSLLSKSESVHEKRSSKEKTKNLWRRIEVTDITEECQKISDNISSIYIHD